MPGAKPIPEKMVEWVKKRNAKSPIRETYSKETYAMFKKYTPVPYAKLTKKQQDIIFREQRAEGMFDENDPDTVTQLVKYYKSINYLFTKIHPDLLPRSAAEDLTDDIYGWMSFSEAEDALKKEDARLSKIERSIEKNGYGDDYPVTIAMVQKSKTAVSGYGNHRLQAVRNLMARGVLPANFEIPVYVVYQDDALKSSLMRKNKRKNACHIK